MTKTRTGRARLLPSRGGHGGPPVHVAQQGLKQRASDVRENQRLSYEQRAAQLAAIADEAAQRITAVLGERGFVAYQEYDGAWIGELTTPTKSSLP